MKLVDVKIEVPDGYELTDLVPVQLNLGDLYLNYFGDVRKWVLGQPSVKKFFRVRKIKQPPKVEVKLKPGWLVKYTYGVYWFLDKPNLLDDGTYHSDGPCFSCPQAMISEFPEGVTLMEVV